MLPAVWVVLCWSFLIWNSTRWWERDNFANRPVVMLLHSKAPPNEHPHCCQAARMCVVHGPFGTGKSTLLVALLEFFVAAGVKRCLVAANTNVAVDRILTGLLECGFTGVLPRCQRRCRPAYMSSMLQSQLRCFETRQHVKQLPLYVWHLTQRQQLANYMPELWDGFACAMQVFLLCGQRGSELLACCPSSCSTVVPVGTRSDATTWLADTHTAHDKHRVLPDSYQFPTVDAPQTAKCMWTASCCTTRCFALRTGATAATGQPCWLTWKLTKEGTSLRSCQTRRRLPALGRAAAHRPPAAAPLAALRRGPARARRRGGRAGRHAQGRHVARRGCCASRGACPGKFARPCCAAYCLVFRRLGCAWKQWLWSFDIMSMMQQLQHAHLTACRCPLRDARMWPQGQTCNDSACSAVCNCC